MKIRTFSICAAATLAVGFMSVTGGTASAEPEECAVLKQTIQGQLRTLSQVSPANYPSVAPGVLASVEALRSQMAQIGCAAGPSAPQKAPTPNPPAAQPPSNHNGPRKSDPWDNLVSTADSTVRFTRCIFEVGVPTGVAVAFASPAVIGAVGAWYGGLIGGTLLEVLNNALQDNLAKSYTDAIVHDCGAVFS